MKKFKIKFGFTSDDGEYVVANSNPIQAETEDEACEELLDQFESMEGKECIIISCEEIL